jgi:hypothetical protein
MWSQTGIYYATLEVVGCREKRCQLAVISRRVGVLEVFSFVWVSCAELAVQWSCAYETDVTRSAIACTDL